MSTASSQYSLAKSGGSHERRTTREDEDPVLDDGEYRLVARVARLELPVSR
jgi:hypothetical protein